MSGIHWCPAATVSSVEAGVGHAVPSGELRTNTFDCPLASSAFQTTWTPPASAATAGPVEKREYVKPDEQANGPSPQSPKPLPLNCTESKGTIAATWAGAPNETPPSVDLERYTSVVGLEDDGEVMNARYTAPSGPTARSVKPPVPCSTGVTFTGSENVTPWSVEREKRIALFVLEKPGYCDQAV